MIAAGKVSAAMGQASEAAWSGDLVTRSYDRGASTERIDIIKAVHRMPDEARGQISLDLRAGSRLRGVDNPVGIFWIAGMRPCHLGEEPAAARLMKIIEHVTADPDLHTPNLGGAAQAAKISDAVISAIPAENV
jgi:hypothetical protein